MRIDECVVRIWFDRPLAADAHGKDIRGAVAGMFPEEPLFHQHDGENLVYSYPKIQYKAFRTIACMVGIEEGGVALGRVNFLGKTMRLGQETYTAESCEASFRRARVEILPKMRRYHFMTPWMALNERNFERYQMTGDPERRRDLLRGILAGNLLSMSKGLGYAVPDRITADLRDIREKTVRLKGNPMLAFQGSFEVNFAIPNYWGIGKSASRGFGAVICVDEGAYD